MREPPILPVLHQIPHKGEPIVVNGIDVSFYEDVESLRGFGEKNKETVVNLTALINRAFSFAYEFDYEHNVISLRQGKYLTKEEKGWGETGKGWRLLCVEEPFNTSRNLGNSADDISVQGLREEFRRASKILYEDVSLELCCQQYVFPRPRTNGTYQYRQGAKRSNYFKYNQGFHYNGSHRQQNGDDDANEYHDDADTDKTGQVVSSASSYQRSEQFNHARPENNNFHQRNSSFQDASNRISGSPDSKQGIGNDMKSTNAQSSNHPAEFSEVTSNNNTNQKSVDQTQIARHTATNNNRIMTHSNQKTTCAQNQKYIGQSNKQQYGFSSNYKSTNGSNRPNRNSDQRFVREPRHNFAHASNSIVTPPTSHKESVGSSLSGNQSNQASNTKSDQNYHKPMQSKSINENNYNKTYPGHNGVKASENGTSVIHSYLTDNTTTTFQRRLSHQSSSDGSNSHASFNSSNTSYSNNSCQPCNTSNKSQGNYHLSQDQNNNTSGGGRKKRHHNNSVNNSGNMDNNNYSSRGSLNNQSKSNMTFSSSMTMGNNNYVTPTTSSGNVMSHYASPQQHSTKGEINNGLASGNSTYNLVASRNLPNNQRSSSNGVNSNSNDNNGHCVNGSKTQTGTHNNNDNRSNSKKAIYGNNAAHGNYSNVTIANNSSAHDGYPYGSKSAKNGYQNNDHIGGPRNNNNSNGGHYSTGQKPMNIVRQSNWFPNNLNLTNVNYQDIDSLAQGPKVPTSEGHPNDENHSIRVSEFNHSGNSHYSDILKSKGNNANNINYANVAAKATNTSGSTNNGHNVGRPVYNGVNRTIGESTNFSIHTNDQNYNLIARNANNSKFNAFKNVGGNNANAPKNPDGSALKVVKPNNSSAPRSMSINASSESNGQRCNNQQNRKSRNKKRVPNINVKKDEDNPLQQNQIPQHMSLSQQQPSFQSEGSGGDKQKG
ncbi:957_t:CDS:2, partial [Acaulospora colombiana]